MFCEFLPARTIISLSGDDTVDFLQGLISNDARILMENKPVYAALLSPQGRFLHDFFLIAGQGKIFIDVQSDRAKDLFSRLRLYKLRSKVEILMEDGLLVAALWGKELALPAQSSCKIYPDPRLPEMGYRLIGTESAIKDFVESGKYKEAGAGQYENLRISLAVPDTKDMIVEKSLLLECGFEQLHGVDFSKGCYIGQEVTARSKFRGQVRKSFYKIKSDSALPGFGEKIIAGDKTIGETRSSQGNIGLALLYNEEYESAKKSGEPFTCSDIQLEIAHAPWINNSK